MSDEIYFIMQIASLSVLFGIAVINIRKSGEYKHELINLKKEQIFNKYLYREIELVLEYFETNSDCRDKNINTTKHSGKLVGYTIPFDSMPAVMLAVRLKAGVNGWYGTFKNRIPFMPVNGIEKEILDVGITLEEYDYVMRERVADELLNYLVITSTYKMDSVYIPLKLDHRVVVDYIKYKEY